jgi:N-methylhydantoinase A
MKLVDQSGSRLGADVGGTFTDFVLMDGAGDRILNFKTPSTPSDPARAILEGIQQLVELHKVNPADIDYFVHGTTLGVNTLIQRTGSLTGLLFTKGFRDVLEIGRLRLPDPTNYFVEKTPPLVPRRLVKEIDERILASGEILKPLDLADVHRSVADLVEVGVDAIAVCFMNSYRNPAHEHETVAYVREHFPKIYVCSSFEIWPQQREYERSLITVINAFISRRMDEYFSHLTQNAKSVGVPAAILTTKSNGGIMTAESAREVPVETLLSGPASGVIGALYIGRQSGYEKLIALDMGGTSADVAVIDGDVLYSTESSVANLPIVMPAVDVNSIGAGGGSIAWVDALGILKVGPRSAGAEPGPACYGRGGNEPTVTDAYVHLGIVDPKSFLGGRLPLDPKLAEKVLGRVGSSLGLTADELAVGILDVTTANMHAQLMPLMARRGIDPRDFALLAYGGAGPTHAMLLAREIGIRKVLIPPSPGTLCALGCLVADIKRDSIKTIYRDSAELAPEELEREFKTLEADARGWLAAQHSPIESSMIVRSADIRYKGQSFDITVPLPALAATSMEAIRAPFHEAYQRIYGIADEKAPVEIINLRVTVVGVTAKPRQAAVLARGSGHPAKHASRSLTEGGGKVTATIYKREDLRAGDTFRGPSVVEASDTTVYVPGGYSGSVDRLGNLLIERD